MFQSIQINGYRGFTHYRMGELGRVNLLVGRNNSGKTSVLEALYVLGSAGDPAALWRVCNRRGERFFDRPNSRPYRSEVDVSHLFTGHRLVSGLAFSIEGRNRLARQQLSVEVDDLPERDKDDEPALMPDEEALASRRLALRIKSSAIRRSQTIPLSRLGGLDADQAEFSRRRLNQAVRDGGGNVHFISTESFTGNELILHWDRIQLTADEGLVLEALRYVDPSIEQIRSFAGGAYGPRGGFIVKRKADVGPVPLGSLGDGAWRMLTMAIVLTQSAGGMLFVDEIDTGLHYTVLAEMWHMIHAAATQFDVQVFATTHSYDCVHSLASICSADGTARGNVTIQRVEADKPVATPFSELEIRTAAERKIELR